MESKQCCIYLQENSSFAKGNKVLQTKMKVLRKNNVLSVNKNKEPQKKTKFCEKKISLANKNEK